MYFKTLMILSLILQSSRENMINICSSWKCVLITVSIQLRKYSIFIKDGTIAVPQFHKRFDIFSHILSFFTLDRIKVNTSVLINTFDVSILICACCCSRNCCVVIKWPINQFFITFACPIFIPFPSH